MDSQQITDHNDNGYEFTIDDIKELDERRRDRLSGKSTTYSWEEAKEIITGKKKINLFLLS
ncbi:MAG: hypothetical protein JWR09_3485 [Mucilaginibacter sp.]|nr:hypothetical protein [Mucilaginibacter sp.]